jgi:tetratricopeptide (TPR) repeat protein
LVGDLAETDVRSARALALSARSGGLPAAEVSTIRGNHELFQGRLDEAVTWYRRARDAAAEGTFARLLAAGTELLALGYAGDPSAPDRARRLLDEIGDSRSACAAYVWFCAGEADLFLDPERAMIRLTRAIELAELTDASFVTGVAGASRASIEARLGDPTVAAGDYQRLVSHWRRAGVWSTQWTMLRSIAGLLARLGRPRDAAVLAGAVRATHSGHRIFGADDTALTELGTRLRVELGDEEYQAATEEGAALDDDAAAEHALRALGEITTSAARR